MTQEQKAKAYDEALERAKNCLKDGTITNTAKSYIETIFPELKESEGEKIKEWLITLVKGHIEWLEDRIRELLSNGQVYGGELVKAKNSLAWLEKQKKDSFDKALKRAFSASAPHIKVLEMNKKMDSIESEDEKIRESLIGGFRIYSSSFDTFGGLKVGDILSWLKKQGEHYNFRKKIKPGDHVTKNEYGVLVNLSQLKRVAKPVAESEKQVEKKPADKVEQKGMNIVEEDMTPFQKKVFCIIDTTIEEEQGLKQVCDELLRLAHDEIIQKPAWSEGDETMITDLSVIVHTYFSEISGIPFKYDLSEDKIKTWLKSLRPQSTWKPSDEQMRFLLKYAEQNNYYGRILTSLYNDLKKLKGK